MEEGRGKEGGKGEKERWRKGGMERRKEDRVWKMDPKHLCENFQLLLLY